MSHDTETWKPIPGFEHYEASSMGRIRMLTHYEKTRNRFGPMTRIRKGKILSQCRRNKHRYWTVSVLNRPRSVHRMVAMAFLPNPGNKPHVNHIDGNGLNNNVDNLEWCTPSENEQHSYTALGKTPWNKGKNYDTTEAQRSRNRHYMTEFMKTWNLYHGSDLTQKQIATIQGISDRTVSSRLRSVEEVMYSG